MIPSSDRTAKDLGQQACIQFQARSSDLTSRDGVEDSDGTQCEGDVHLSHRIAIQWNHLKSCCRTRLRGAKTPCDATAEWGCYICLGTWECLRHQSGCSFGTLGPAFQNNENDENVHSINSFLDVFFKRIPGFPDPLRFHGFSITSHISQVKGRAGRVTHKLLLASAAAHSTIGKEQRHTSTFLHEFHGFCKPEAEVTLELDPNLELDKWSRSLRLGIKMHRITLQSTTVLLSKACKEPVLWIGGATAMERDNAVVIQMQLHSIQASLPWASQANIAKPSVCNAIRKGWGVSGSL